LAERRAQRKGEHQNVKPQTGARDQRQADELSLLFDAGKAVTSDLSFNGMISQLEASVKQLVDADATLFVINDHLGLELVGSLDLRRRHRVPTHYDLCQDVATDVARSGRPRCMTCVPNSAECRFFSMACEDGGHHHIASVPLLRGGKPIGSISAFRQNKPPFSKKDLKLLERFAGVAAIAVNNSLAFEREHWVAEKLQLVLLPSREFEIPGFAVGGSYAAATEGSKVGGDIYDIVHLDGPRYSVLIADISGKGVDAAVHTAMVKYITRGLLMSEPDPRAVVKKLNEAVCRDLPPEVFVTLFLGILDVEQRRLAYVNAGHDQPLFYLKERGCCTTCEVTGRALGIVEGSEYEACHQGFASGDVLVLYTDGVTDARQGDKFLGIEGLERLVVDNADRPAPELVSAILTGVGQFARKRLQDDAAILAIQAL